jgi:stage III sporulation protein AB
MKLLGALMIIFGCGGVGFTLAASYRYQEQSLLQLLRAVEYMFCDLQYRLTPLPELCDNAAQSCTGCIRKVLQQLKLELDKQVVPDASVCMHVTMKQHDQLPERLYGCLELLGETLGRFDLQGQLQGLAAVKKNAEFELEQLRRNQDVRLRNYRTLSICAGAALVILLF